MALDITVNIHGARIAKAEVLKGGTGTLKFMHGELEYTVLTVFLPPSVAKATADAFNEAMKEHLEAGQ